MIGISNETIEDFINFLFNTEPFSSLMQGSNRDGFKNIFVKLLKDLYQNIPADAINYLEKNASDIFLNLLYKEAGISDKMIKRVPAALKIRLSYLLNTLNVNRASQRVFNLFHEALEEFFPKMNIYLIEVSPDDLGKNDQLKYNLEPRYISDPDNILEEVTYSELSGTFLMRPEQFIDREEKFSNIYPDYKSKQRIINIFPIKTGIIYIQNPSGIGQAHFDDYIPLMQMIGATLQKNSTFQWKMYQDDPDKQQIPFLDFIKICTYLKYKEFEFKQPTYRWQTEPLETYRDKNKLLEWNNALFQAKENGLSWLSFFTPVSQKLNDMILNDEDLKEAERLEIAYKGLKRSGLSNGRPNLNQFKTDWNTLRSHDRNTSIRLVSDINEFRNELIGIEPLSVGDLELIMLERFPCLLVGAARDAIFHIKKLYNTNKDNTLDETNGLVFLVNKFNANEEFNEFIFSKYGRMELVEKDETQLLYDLFYWYIVTGAVPLLKNYWQIKLIKMPELKDLHYSDPLMNNKLVFNKLYAELISDTNSHLLPELKDIIKIKYRKIIEKIDALGIDQKTTPETYVMLFLNLWKVIQVEIPIDKRIQTFWNEFFMRMIMGSSFKDFFFDPIMELFLEYWFPMECSTQNRDIQTVLIKDKMQTIPLESRQYFYWSKEVTSITHQKDQVQITIINEDGTVKETFNELFKEIEPRPVQFPSI